MQSEEIAESPHRAELFGFEFGNACMCCDPVDSSTSRKTHMKRYKRKIHSKRLIQCGNALKITMTTRRTPLTRGYKKLQLHIKCIFCLPSKMIDGGIIRWFFHQYVLIYQMRAKALAHFLWFGYGDFNEEFRMIIRWNLFHNIATGFVRLQQENTRENENGIGLKMKQSYKNNERQPKGERESNKKIE